MRVDFWQESKKDGKMQYKCKNTSAVKPEGTRRMTLLRPLMPLTPVEQTKCINGLDKVILRVSSGFTAKVILHLHCIAFFHLFWILAKNQHALFYMTNKIYPKKNIKYDE